MLLIFLNVTYEDWTYGFVAMVRGLVAVTWISPLILLFDAIQSFRHKMQDAKERGATPKNKNRILLTWIFRVFVLFCVFTWIFLAWGELHGWSLAAILLVKAGIEWTFFYVRHTRLHF